MPQKIRSIIGSPDISGVLSSVEQLLEESVGAEPFIIDRDAVQRFDLTQIDFEALAGLFAVGKKNTAAQQLRASLERRIDRTAQLNPTRIDYAAKLQEVIDRYNAGSSNIDTLFDELKRLADSLTEEEERHCPTRPISHRRGDTTSGRDTVDNRKTAAADRRFAQSEIIVASCHPLVPREAEELAGDSGVQRNKSQLLPVASLRLPTEAIAAVEDCFSDESVRIHLPAAEPLLEWSLKLRRGEDLDLHVAEIRQHLYVE